MKRGRDAIDRAYHREDIGREVDAVTSISSPSMTMKYWPEVLAMAAASATGIESEPLLTGPVTVVTAPPAPIAGLPVKQGDRLGGTAVIRQRDLGPD